MTSALVRKLECYLPLSDVDRAGLEALQFKFHSIAAKSEVEAILPAGGAVHQIQTGYACRYRQLPDGRRQISGLMIPGDFIDLRKFVVTGAEHGVFGLTELALMGYDAASLLRVLEARPRSAQAVWRALLAEESIAQEWLVSLGKRSALERVAHLICELYVRHTVMNEGAGRTFTLPITQREIGDAMGLSTVHVNRTLRELRQRGLAKLQSGQMEILNFEKLADLAMFSPTYLQFRNRTANRH
ncbi:Crp/Fnr family transcriptional regulator [Pelagibacterium limicola]|uniref:Crp/Fnr family transcriptional regulator n=1 Tax=Pelagibacterium limicola TaxID=2791022 RepID=UPI0018AFF7E2|nr:Crp/Fnr family transcriptional regulator [Pelagibacterium limicola]